MRCSFIKMQGIGNDFVLVDAREQDFRPSPDQVRRLADRRLQLGFDQLLMIEKTDTPNVHAFLRIHNADGSEASACGNGTRCAALFLMRENKAKKITLETKSGQCVCTQESEKTTHICVDMGIPSFDWKKIPLSAQQECLHIVRNWGPLADPVAVHVGNPHVVFFVRDVDKTLLETWGAKIANDPLFPERTNVSIAEVVSRRILRLCVWERGCGLTPACGSAAVAAFCAAVRRDLMERRGEVRQEGGTLGITWRESDNHVLQTGPARFVFFAILAEDV